MNPETARQLLGLNNPACSAAEVETAWADRAGAYEPRLAAADATTSAQLEQELAQLLAAKSVLLAASAAPASRSGGPALPPMTSVVRSSSPRPATGSVLPPLPPAAALTAPAAGSINFALGTVLAGRYEIRGLLGQGGMGVVYTACDRLKRNEEIAIKVLTPALLSNPSAKERFINEAIIATRLNHPGIVKVHSPEQHGDLIFLTMEKLEGRSLRQVLFDCQTRGAQLAVPEILRIARALSDALHYAHKLPTPIVHRDIKPENVFICQDGSLRLMDFGLAQNLAGPQLTAVATTMGTMHYMAPEQSGDARNVDHRADQYAFAVTLYEMLVGRVPQGKFQDPRSLRKGVSATLSAAVMRGLSTAPGKRFPDMAAFRTQLVEKDGGVGRWFAPENRDMIATAAFVVVLLGGAAYMAFGGGKKPEAAASPFAPAGGGSGLTSPVRPATGPATPVQTGGISVVTTPAGAEVTIGSQYAANSPARFTNVPVGRYPVKVLLKNYKEVTFDVEVVAGNFASKNVTLEPRLVVDSAVDFYNQTLRIMQDADDLKRAGKGTAAQDKWAEALERLKFLSAQNKTWQPLAVAQRIRECEANLRKTP